MEFNIEKQILQVCTDLVLFTIYKYTFHLI